METEGVATPGEAGEWGAPAKSAGPLHRPPHPRRSSRASGARLSGGARLRLGHAPGPNAAGEMTHVRTRSRSPRPALNRRREPEAGATAAAPGVPILTGVPHHARTACRHTQGSKVTPPSGQTESFNKQYYYYDCEHY